MTWSSSGVLQGCSLGPIFSLLLVNELDDSVCNIAIYTDGTTLYYNCD